MRGSIQYPSYECSVKTGLVFIAAVCFLVGGAWLLVSSQRPSIRTVALELPATGVLADSGDVFLLDEKAGTILQIGTFSNAGGTTTLSLRMPEDQFDGAHRWQANLWERRYTDYRPYFEFLNDKRLRTSLSEIVSQILQDADLKERTERLGAGVLEELFAKVQPRLAEITQDPEFRSLLIDVTLEEAKAYLARRNESEVERTWVEPMSNLVLSKARQWPWAEWVEEIVDDPETRESFSALLTEMEPYFREALQEFLWNRDHLLRPGSEYAPNVRLLWVARRTLFGAREPAITLLSGSEGQKLAPGNILNVRTIE